MTVNDKLKKEVRELNEAIKEYQDRNHYLTLKLKYCSIELKRYQKLVDRIK